MKLLAGLLPMVLVACSGESAVAEPEALALAPDQPTGSIVTSFAWSAPCEVRVIEEHLKKGQRVVSRYTMALQPAAEGEGFVLSKRDFELLSFGGQKLDSPEMREALAPVTAALKAIPPISVSVAGRSQGIADFERYLIDLEGSLADMAEQFPSQKDGLEKTLRMMKLPMVRPILEQGASLPWQTWVEAWIDLDLAVGEETAIREEVAAADGQSVGMEFVIRNHGLVQRPSGQVKLSMTSEAGGDQLAVAVTQLARELVAELQAAADIDAPGEVRVVTTTEVVTDPRSLRPSWAAYQRTITARVGDEERQRLERREYRFDWPVD